MTSHLTITGSRKVDEVRSSLPTIISAGGSAAEYAYREFFDAEVENDHTRKAYRTAVLRFLSVCESEDVSLQNVTPWFVSNHIKGLTSVRNGKLASVRTRKQHLAAIRQFFDVLVIRHAVALNPALSVKGPRFSESEGSTPAISPADIQRVFDAIDLGTEDKPNVIGIRDTAILGVLAYTGARSGAVCGVRLRDYFSDGTQWMLRFHEKNGKVRKIPVRHDLQQSIDAYVNISGVESGDGDSPLFRASDGQSRVLSERPLRGKWLLRMVKRRCRNAGLSTAAITGHSYRAAVATDLLAQGVQLSDVQFLLGHSDPRTTQSYDRSKNAVTRNLVERISH